jgi:dTDP-4-amino-4,6-dideoxygalactose transaminase
MMTNQPIPFLDLVTPHRELEQELVEAFRRVMRSAHFIGGPEVETFEQEFADYCGTRYCVGLASGTDAVRFAVMAAGVRPGDAVITVAHTFIATVEGISQAGARTEFVDIDERTFNMSAASLASYLEACPIDRKSGRPVGQRSGAPIGAILPVHLYGQLADIAAITRIAERYGLVVIEDACQAHGAEYQGRGRAGSLARAAAFSFYPGKNLGACGEAGAVTTDDEKVATFVRRIRDHGQSQKYYHQMEGYNGRLDAMQAAFLRIKLRQLDHWNALRRVAAGRYSELLAPLAKTGVITLPSEPEWSQGVYHLYVVRTADRDRLAKTLLASGIQTGFHYPVPLHQQECYRHWGYAPGSLPVTERIASDIISLPMFPGLTSEQQQRISDELVRALTPSAAGSAR